MCSLSPLIIVIINFYLLLILSYLVYGYGRWELCLQVFRGVHWSDDIIINFLIIIIFILILFMALTDKNCLCRCSEVFIGQTMSSIMRMWAFGITCSPPTMSWASSVALAPTSSSARVLLLKLVSNCSWVQACSVFPKPPFLHSPPGGYKYPTPCSTTATKESYLAVELYQTAGQPKEVNKWAMYAVSIYSIMQCMQYHGN